MNSKAENEIRKKSAEILLNKYKLENEKLIAEKKRLEIYKKKIIGYVLICASSIIFLLSVSLFITDIQLVILGMVAIALIGLSIFLIFIYLPKTHLSELVNNTLKTTLINLNHAISRFDLQNSAVFLLKDEIIFQFIPFASDKGEKEMPTRDLLKKTIFEIPNHGILLHPTGTALFELAINEFQMDISKISLNQIEVFLQVLLIDQLNLIQSLSFTKLDKGRFKLVISGNFFSQTYQLEKLDSMITTQIGCPICSFVSLLLVRLTKRTILLKSHEYKQDEDSSSVIFELGESYH